MALAASNALPPPKPSTSSQFSFLASAAPCSIVESSGSPATEKVAALTPVSRRIFNNGPARFSSRPVTTNARLPNSLAMAPASHSVPAPKMIFVAVVNSKRIFNQKVGRASSRAALDLGRSGSSAASPHRSPLLVLGKNLVELYAETRLGHHRRHRLAPDRIMLRFLVRGGGLGVPINLHQHEPRRIVLLLQNVEAQDTRLQQTQARVEARRLRERLHRIRFDMNMNLDHKHVRRIRESLKKHKPSTD